MNINLSAYIDDLLIMTKTDWSNQLKKIRLMLQKKSYNGLKCNIEKLFFVCFGISPINKVRCYSKNISAKEQNLGVCIHGFSKLLYGYVF